MLCAQPWGPEQTADHKSKKQTRGCNKALGLALLAAAQCCQLLKSVPIFCVCLWVGGEMIKRPYAHSDIHLPLFLTTFCLGTWSRSKTFAEKLKTWIPATSWKDFSEKGRKQLGKLIEIHISWEKNVDYVLFHRTLVFWRGQMHKNLVHKSRIARKSSFCFCL